MYSLMHLLMPGMLQQAIEEMGIFDGLYIATKYPWNI